MLNDDCINRWKHEIKNNFDLDNLEAYDGHDTVCMIGLDSNKNMAVGVSTSGLFLKKAGRVGDSSVIGSGFYCDSLVGGAAATGVGEDIMKGCLSISIINRMKLKQDIQSSCEDAIKEHTERFNLSKYKAGIRIYHKKFGEGTINYVEKEGDDLKVDITFDKVGHKRLMAKFAKLEII